MYVSTGGGGGWVILCGFIGGAVFWLVAFIIDTIRNRSPYSLEENQKTTEILSYWASLGVALGMLFCVFLEH